MTFDDKTADNIWEAWKAHSNIFQTRKDQKHFS